MSSEEYGYEKDFLKNDEEFLDFLSKATGYDAKESKDAMALMRDKSKRDTKEVKELLERINDERYGDPTIRMILQPNNEAIIFIEESRSLPIDNVAFSTMEEYISIRKNDENYTVDVFLEEFPLDFITPDEYECENPFLPTRERLIEKYHETEPMGAREALKRYKENAEQRMVAFRQIGPARVIQELDAQLLDSQTITKRRQATKFKGEGTVQEKKHNKSEYFEIGEVEFPDTYELYQINSDIIGLDPSSGDSEHVYILTMKDTSTDRMYALFVDENNDAVKEKDAIAAIASTQFIPDGEGGLRPLTKQEYLEMEAES